MVDTDDRTVFLHQAARDDQDGFSAFIEVLNRFTTMAGPSQQRRGIRYHAVPPANSPASHLPPQQRLTSQAASDTNTLLQPNRKPPRALNLNSPGLRLCSQGAWRLCRPDYWVLARERGSPKALTLQSLGLRLCSQGAWRLGRSG